MDRGYLDELQTLLGMKREPLLSDEQIVQVGLGVFDRASVKKSRPLQHLYNAKYCGAAQVRDHYEAARAKDAELIQRLVDVLDWYVKEDDVMEGGEWDEMNAPWIEGRNEAEKVLAAAEAEGFKPTEQ